MSLTTYSQILEIVRQEAEQLRASEYPEDLLNEFADSQTPIMYGDIFEEWGKLPNEYCDEWTQFGMDEFFLEGGIMTLMQVDLRLYYESLFAQAWDEIQSEAKLAE